MTIGSPPRKMGQSRRKKERSHSFCWVCLHNPPYGKCLVCGYSKGKDGIDPKFKCRFEWLQETFRQLKRYSQRSTGNPDLDIEIYKKFCGWGSGMIPYRDPGTYKVVYLYHNQTPWEVNPEMNGVEWDKLTEQDREEIMDDYTLPSDSPHDCQTWCRKYPRSTGEIDAVQRSEGG